MHRVLLLQNDTVWGLMVVILVFEGNPPAAAKSLFCLPRNKEVACRNRQLLQKAKSWDYDCPAKVNRGRYPSSVAVLFGFVLERGHTDGQGEWNRQVNRNKESQWETEESVCMSQASFWRGVSPQGDVFEADVDISECMHHIQPLTATLTELKTLCHSKYNECFFFYKEIGKRPMQWGIL